VKRPLPPTYFFGSIILMGILHWLLPLKQLVVWPCRWLGVLPLSAGIAVDLIANAMFNKRGTTVKPFEKSTVLVTTGLFAVTRNPFYLGMALILLGVAVLLGSATPLVVVPIYVLAMTKAFIEPEEKMLEEAFGDQFRQYRERVRTWL